MSDLKPCPFCGGTVSVALTDDGDGSKWWFITRGDEDNGCRCRVFMESDKFYGNGRAEKKALIKAWNRRVPNEQSHTHGANDAGH